MPPTLAPQAGTVRCAAHCIDLVPIGIAAQRDSRIAMQCIARAAIRRESRVASQLFDEDGLLQAAWGGPSRASRKIVV